MVSEHVSGQDFAGYRVAAALISVQGCAAGADKYPYSLK
jgi:hypothetical protein